MDQTQQDLREHFRSSTDEELLQRYASGDLTEQAQALAGAELRRRGLALPAMPAADAPTAYLGDLQPVASFFNATDAQVLLSCFQVSGVPALLADANLIQTCSLLTPALGGVRILVPAAYVAQAREVLAAFERGDLRLDDDTDVGKLDAR